MMKVDGLDKAIIGIGMRCGSDDVLIYDYKKCIKENKKAPIKIKNIVREIYNPFTDSQISKEISRMLKDEDITADVDVVFQSIENLHKACPNHLGDWYFSGDYPTPGGNKIVNKAFINYYDGLKIRAY